MTPGTGTCDGCDREGPVQQLEEVILPSGAMIVCPECRYHAEELAANSTADCGGCSATVTAADLARTELPDGVELILCPDCRDSVSAGQRPAGAPTTDDDPSRTKSRNGSGPERASAVSTGSPSDGSASRANGGTSAGTADGDGTAAETGSPGSAASGTATSTGGTAGSAGGTAGSASETSSGSSEAAADARDAVTDGATGKPATTQNPCDQCGCLFSIELYQVVTVDGRREEFCPDCKDEGLEEGIVRDVELRRAQAYEVLGLAGSADPDDVRQAYLEQVKEVHPDRSDGDRAEFMLVQQAYERLRDD